MSKETTDKAARDRNLLFGVIAVQLHFIQPVDLAKAAAVWATKTQRDLGQILVDMKLIKASDKAVIDQLIFQKISMHGGDVAGTLASFGGGRAVAESFSPDSFSWSGSGGYAAETSEPSRDPMEDTTDFTWSQSSRERQKVAIEQPNRYTIKGERGRGAIGRVLVAFDENIGREVAIKELLTGVGTGSSGGANRSPSKHTAEATARFLREARITGQLNHPSIVPVFEIARRPDDSLYYTMRLVQGRNMAEHLRECKDLTDRMKYVPNFLDICQAMAYAHSRNVIHRDLKPSNVMLGDWGETIVLDWGLAKVQGWDEDSTDSLDAAMRAIADAGVCETLQGAPMGTPSYMSPEQAEGLIKKVDKRSDVWSLGAMLYELLAGRPPFIGHSAFEVMGKVMKNDVGLVQEIEPEAPLEFCAIAHKCLERERDKRFADAGELAAKIERVSQVVFGAMSFVRVREERNVAVEQKRIADEQRMIAEEQRRIAEEQKKLAEEQRALAEKREREARRNLAEAYFQYGLRSEQERRFNDARVYFAKALALTGREDARSALYRQATRRFKVTLTKILDGHQERVTAVAFSPDGSHLATASWDETVKIWSVELGDCVKTLPGHDAWVTSVAFSPDGEMVLAGSAESARLWNVETGAVARELRGHEAEVMSVAFSPDGKIIATGGVDQTIVLWDAAAGEIIRTMKGHEDWVTSLAFSADQRMLVSGSWDGSVKLWDFESGECLMTLRGHDDEVNSVQIDMECIHALSASNDKTLKLWRIETGECVKTFRGHSDRVFSNSLHPLGEMAVSGGDDHSLRVWSLDYEDCELSFTGHEGRICSVQFSPDGKNLASASWDKTARLWKVSEESSAMTLWGHESDVLCAAYSPDGRRVLSGGEDGTFCLFNASSGELIKSRAAHVAPISAVAFMPNGAGFITASWDHTIKLWNAKTLENVMKFEGHEDDVLDAVFTMDGRGLVSAGYDNSCRLWDVRSGKCLRTLTEHNYPVLACDASPDGGYVLTGSCSEREGFDCVKGEMRLWSIRTGDCLRRFVGHKDNVLTVAFSPDGRKVVSGSLESVMIWSVQSGEKILTMSGHDFWVKSVAFSPDGTYLVSGGDDGLVKIWSAETGACLLTLEGHEGAVCKTRFSPDGRSVLSAAKDMTARIWPIVFDLLESTGEELFDAARAETGMALDGFKVVQDVGRPESADL